MATVTAYPSSYTGGAQWEWVSYAYVEGDGAFAQLKHGTGSSDLHFSGFGLNIPSGVTINSVTIYRSSKRDGTSGAVYHQIQAYKGSTPVGTNHQGPALTNAASETSTSNTGTWTAEELNNSFGIYLAANRVYNYSYLDYVKVVVDYTVVVTAGAEVEGSGSVEVTAYKIVTAQPNITGAGQLEAAAIIRTFFAVYTVYADPEFELNTFVDDVLEFMVEIDDAVELVVFVDEEIEPAVYVDDEIELEVVVV